MFHFGEGEISILVGPVGVVTTVACPRPGISYGSSASGVAVPIVLASSSDRSRHHLPQVGLRRAPRLHPWLYR